MDSVTSFLNNQNSFSKEYLIKYFLIEILLEFNKGLMAILSFVWEILLDLFGP